MPDTALLLDLDHTLLESDASEALDHALASVGSRAIDRDELSRSRRNMDLGWARRLLPHAADELEQPRGAARQRGRRAAYERERRQQRGQLAGSQRLGAEFGPGFVRYDEERAAWGDQRGHAGRVRRPPVARQAMEQAAVDRDVVSTLELGRGDIVEHEYDGACARLVGTRAGVAERAWRDVECGHAKPALRRRDRDHAVASAKIDEAATRGMVCRERLGQRRIERLGVPR
jgi:hypothetical protein